MSEKLEKLVSCLEMLPTRKELSHHIAKIKKMEADNPKDDENLAASAAVTLLVDKSEIMDLPKNQALKQFCQSLRPTQLYLDPLIKKKLSGLDNGPTPLLPSKKR